MAKQLWFKFNLLLLQQLVELVRLLKEFVLTLVLVVVEQQVDKCSKFKLMKLMQQLPLQTG
ncbi:MAG: hypothetical protein CL557_11830 [Alphaproteobacteria bacterium]|nr:hypothetical protein [Alphaproteobacteria bacterium]